MSTTPRLCLALMVLATFVAVCSRPAPARLVQSSSATIPAGFSDTLVARVSAPTALAFEPDGTLLVAGQFGRLLAFDGDALRSTPVLDLTGKVCADRERGLLGVAVDPEFSANRSIYVYYTFRAFGTCEWNSTRAPVNRVSRFALTSEGVADPRSETVLIDNIPSPEGIHNAGDLHFGKDGFLYVSVGDGGCDYARPAVCEGGSDAARGANNDAARDRHVLLGKILRITRAGGVPATNPFLGPTSVSCAAAGRAAAGQVCREIYALGLRNPFRLAFDPNAEGTRFFVNDVGQDAWEEIDLGRAGADYGWNVREGHCLGNSFTACSAPPAGVSDPVYDYSHRTGCTAITAGAFVPDGVWPPGYGDDYLYGDFTCGKIFRLSPDATRGLQAEEFVTGLGSNSVTGMSFGPFGPGKALYYMTYVPGGQVRRIVYTGSGNRPPEAVARATPTAGELPLTVTFDGRASSDPDGDRLTYGWNFGDGASGAGAVTTHTFTTTSTYRVRLAVQDGRGGEAEDTIRIDAGNSAPVPTILAPSRAARFHVGQTITLRGNATDPEDGTLAGSELSWTVLLRHADHAHPFLPATSGDQVRFRTPAPESLSAAASSYLVVRLRATDSNGRATTASRRLQPSRVKVTLATKPSGLLLAANGSWFRAPRTFSSWEGYGIGVRARRDQTDRLGRRFRFKSWSDGGRRVHTIVTPSGPRTYRATFVRRRTPAASSG